MVKVNILIWNKIITFLSGSSENLGVILFITATILGVSIGLLQKKVNILAIVTPLIYLSATNSLSHVLLIHGRLNTCIKTTTGIISNSERYKTEFAAAMGIESIHDIKASVISKTLLNTTKIAKGTEPEVLYSHFYKTRNGILKTAFFGDGMDRSALLIALMIASILLMFLYLAKKSMIIGIIVAVSMIIPARGNNLILYFCVLFTLFFLLTSVFVGKKRDDARNSILTNGAKRSETQHSH